MHRLRHFILFVKLWWHFRKDAWNYCGPWTPVEADIQFRRPQPSNNTTSSTGVETKWGISV